MEKNGQLKFQHLIKLAPSLLYFASQIYFKIFLIFTLQKIPYLVSLFSFPIYPLFVHRIAKGVYSSSIHHVCSQGLMSFKVLNFFFSYMFIICLRFVETRRLFSSSLPIIYSRFKVYNFVIMLSLFFSYLFIVCSGFKICWSNAVFLFLFAHHQGLGFRVYNFLRMMNFLSSCLFIIINACVRGLGYVVVSSFFLPMYSSSTHQIV